MTTDSPAAAPALKEIFDRARFQHIAAETATVWPGFDRKRFVGLATSGLHELGIMQRMRRTAESLQATLPPDFAEAVGIIRQLAPRIGHGFAAIALPEYVALYGRQHHRLSMEALRDLTRYGSAEFAIRHFLLEDFDATLAVMRDWARDDNEHVRRLASEGSRPRLPWSFQLKPVLADPALTLPILEALQDDPSLYVRKSVANHLNDISKDSPDWLLDRLADWPTERTHTGWIVRHALRTLIKKGDSRALGLIGTTGRPSVRVDAFAVTPSALKLGDRVFLNASLVSTSATTQRLVVDYAVHYVKKNGNASRKVFKLRETELAAGAAQSFAISQVVRDFTTRKHHPGFHRVELMVNGEVVAETGFSLDIPK